MPTLDRQASEQAAEEGIARSDSNALDLWKRAADKLIEHVARTHYEFTADDVWAAGLAPNPTGSNTALGARFRHAASEGLVARTGQTIRTEQIKSHRRPVVLWRSLVCPGPPPPCPHCDGTGTLKET